MLSWLLYFTAKNKLSSPINSFLCHIPILACKQCIFQHFKVYKFSLGLYLNNQVKENANSHSL